MLLGCGGRLDVRLEQGHVTGRGTGCLHRRASKEGRRLEERIRQQIPLLRVGNRRDDMGEEELSPLHRREGRGSREPGGQVAARLGEGFFQLVNDCLVSSLRHIFMKGPEQGYNGPCEEAVGMEHGAE